MRIGELRDEDFGGLEEKLRPSGHLKALRNTNEIFTSE